MKQNRIRFIAWILLVVLMMQAAPMGVQATEIGKTALTSDVLTPEYLVGTWEGTYTGSGDPVTDLRNIKLEIECCDEDGLFLGRATINSGAVQYYISGNVDFADGALSFIGNDWIVNNAGFTKFIEFAGNVSCINGTMTGLVGGDVAKTFSLDKKYDTQTLDRVINFSNVPRDWVGTYAGKNGNITVPRNIELHIDKIKVTGSMSGIAVVSPPGDADKQYEEYAANGSYYFKGSINPYTLKINIQGYKWIDHPPGRKNEDFGFVALTGQIALAENIDDSSINGSTPSGAWTMAVIDYKCFDKDSKFIFNTHTANFFNMDTTGFPKRDEEFKDVIGFYKVDTYLPKKFPPSYWLRLQIKANDIEDEVLKLAVWVWNGACYGMAATMGLLHDGRIGIRDLTDDPEIQEGATYYDLKAPWKDPKLMDVLHAWQLSQKISAGNPQNTAVSKTFYNKDNQILYWGDNMDSLSVFLARMVLECKKEKVFLLNYRRTDPDKKIGNFFHSVLVTGCRFDSENQEYILDIYDSSSARPTPTPGKTASKACEFRISKDYSAFRYKSFDNQGNENIEMGTGKWEQEAIGQWLDMYIINLDSLSETKKLLHGADAQATSTMGLETDSQESDEIHSVLWFKLGTAAFTIENENGEYLTYDGEHFSGTMGIYDFKMTVAGEQSQLGIEVDSSQSFKITNIESSIDLEVVNENALMVLSGTNLDCATLDEVNGIEIDGDQYSFDAVLTTDLISEDELGLVSISASVDSGKVSIASDGVQATVKSENPLEDVTTKTYIGTEVYERDLDDGMTDLVVDATDTTTNVLKFTDVPEDSFYHDPVLWAVNQGITSGTSDTTFSPAASCNRAQAVTFLWAAAGKPEPTITEHSFVDVPKGSFCEKAVLWAVEKGITTGTDETHFSPLATCNRATIVTFLYKAFNSPEVSAAKNPFEDVPDESWYTVPALWAKENGITSGTDATHFSPASLCNRAQIVTFLYGAYN